MPGRNDPVARFTPSKLSTAGIHGCWPREGGAIQHDGIDLKRGTVTIRRAYSWQELSPFPKSKRVRVVPLDETWKELYLSHPTSIDPSAFVFQRNGKPLFMTWALKKWREAADKGRYPRISLYQGTRHSIASQAINRDVPLFA